MKTNDVIALGNALMDILVEVDESMLTELELKKGEMCLANKDQAIKLLTQIQASNLQAEYVPGGSAANTIRGITLLGGKTILCGAIGKDVHGALYEQEICRAGVVSRLQKSSTITGCALTFITPDTQRTFFVHLGASLEMKKEDLLENDIKQSKILHIEGYQLEGNTKEAVLHALMLAKKNQTLISLDLADPGVVRRNKPIIKEVVTNYADIIFANEEEAKEYTGKVAHAAVVELGQRAQLAIVKLGKSGSLLYHNKSIITIPAVIANAIDTTGAGDSYAAGLLYGFCNNWTLDKAAGLGSLLAARVVEQKGVRLVGIDADLLKKEILKK